MKLLLIEDYAETIEVIRFYCNSKGNIDFQVINNGKEGLEAIQKDDFDLILLDLAMPEFSGYDIVKALKEEGILESKNIVIFSASSDRTLIEEMRKKGVKDILKKPCSLEELTDMIEKFRPVK
jgi:two-component system, OmpR family, response regulator